MSETNVLSGREKLKQAVERDVSDGSMTGREKECWDKFNWIIARSEHYAEKTGISPDEILDAWENDRSYWYMNYYQEANQPEIKGDNVRVFNTVEELLEDIGEMKFRCPACNGISTNPYSCDSGELLEHDKVCDWKAYGLFGTLGKGANVFVKDKIRVETIFMPLSWED